MKERPAIAMVLAFSAPLAVKWQRAHECKKTAGAKISVGRFLSGPLYPCYLHTKKQIEAHIMRLNSRRKPTIDCKNALMASQCSSMTDKGLVKLHLQLRTLKSGMRWATVARLGLAAGVALLVLLALTVVTNEIRATYEALHPTESFQRRPEQNWGYTPLLAELPEPVVKFGVWYSKTVENTVALVVDTDPSKSSITAKTSALGFSLTYGFILLLVICIGYSEARRKARKRLGAIIKYYDKR